jgi:hypothetical protein
MHEPRGVCPFQQGVGDVVFLPVQGNNALLDAVLDDQAIDGDRSLLTDAMSAVGGLVLNRRIPPAERLNSRNGFCGQLFPALHGGAQDLGEGTGGGDPRSLDR